MHELLAHRARLTVSRDKFVTAVVVSGQSKVFDPEGIAHVAMVEPWDRVNTHTKAHSQKIGGDLT